MARKTWTVFAAAASALALVLACGGEGPPAPYNVTVSNLAGAADLRWECDVGADRFVIQRSDTVDYNFRDWAWKAGAEREFIDYEVVAGNTYYYRVAAWYDAASGGGTSGWSEYSQPVSVKFE